MILHWRQLELFYGPDVNRHRAALSQAGQTSYALLMCNWTPSGSRRMASSSGDHAEQRLLQDSIWHIELDAAFQQWTPQLNDPIVVTIAINRSPCASCADRLSDALHQLHYRYAARFPHMRFILASKGYYQGDFVGTGAGGGISRDRVTTGRGMARLKEAGWTNCVLQFGDRLSARGEELLEFLEPDLRRRHTPVRLSS
ncbi:hypothetical protein FKG94_00770 [Exilibacterium tricleocarpae]|uniref:Uncharacterized protein n=1 Tax=Exilibacterium tricleocarpae TaxID=2591008 RepID=A0A545U9H0_9GAMM|nr:hypothetical protein [Exilibacterium tricleocarpae]TQV86122.1 hypothetical protein FKG94_00770 [Exilibacterium tricleocarpae]